VSIPGFEFFGVGRILFGRGQYDRVAEIAATLGRAALVVYNGDERGKGGLLDGFERLLHAQGLSTVFVRQRGEPTVENVDRALSMALGSECDIVIALGGGSAIDTAKAVAGLVTNAGTAIDYMEVVGKGQKITRPALPWIAIPTTAGTGAEATRNAVIGLPEKKFKASIRSELLLPRVAVIDPEVQLDVPPAVTAASGMDALCQLIESYTSSNANPVTDALALQGVSLASKSLRRAFTDGHDLEAREHMALAALLSGVTLTSAGLGAVHGFAAPLGANFPVPHGVVCAALLPHVIKANSESRDERTLARYATIGRAMAGDDKLSSDAAIQHVIEETASLARELRIPRLLTFGVTPERIPEMVALARKASSMRYNLVALSDETLGIILAHAI
jgi:alcohol dehydrogenase class IV